MDDLVIEIINSCLKYFFSLALSCGNHSLRMWWCPRFCQGDQRVWTGVFHLVLDTGCPPQWPPLSTSAPFRALTTSTTPR